MGKERLTTEEFIRKAKAVHGDRYDYSKTVYVNQKTNVVITCLVHGDFTQCPTNHYNGAGCPMCSKNKRMTTDDFILRAKAIHGEKYDYSKVNYINNRTKVTIICPNHGEFQQAPDKHLHGSECPACAKIKAKQTMIDRYGSPHALQSAEIREKMKETVRTRYGVDNVSQSTDVQDKIKETCMTKYGTEYALSSPDVREKIHETVKAKYGVDSVLESADVIAKRNKTVEARYGVKNVMQCDDIKQRMSDTMMSKYGVSNPMRLKSVKYTVVERRKSTCVRKYGVESVLQSDQIRRKAEATMMSKYGVLNAMQNGDIVSKNFDVRKENGTLSTSKPEEMLYAMLIERFGVSDVERQYQSDRYDFACDFYVRSRDLYIELNATWTHGGHWYDKDSNADTVVLEAWKSKGSEYYITAVEVWTERDVSKRETAKKNNLNYLVFWDAELRDADLWFACNCPDAQDYNRMYSWIPERELKNTLIKSTYSMIAKAYQYDVFYKHEIELWNENKYFRGLSLQMFIYYNRLKYLGKTPDELTDAEILRGFTISGALKGYTIFDTKLMQAVIDKYNIRSVYDPCAGWGERLLCCADNKIRYIGIDINEALFDGYQRMIADNNIQNAEIIIADSAKYEPDVCTDAVITCPPYGDIEKYSDSADAAENMSYNDFLDWWKKVVINAAKTKSKYFCFQINKKYREAMTEIVAGNSYELIDELYFDSNKSSHFNRRAGVINKTEYEVMLVFKRTEPVALSISEIRERSGLSQKEFAEFLQIPLRNIQLWEAGTRTPPDYVVNLISKIMS